MVGKIDLQQRRSIAQLRSELAVGVARVCVSAWMVVRDYEAESTRYYCNPEDFSRVSGAFVQAAQGCEVVALGAEFGVKEDCKEMFFVRLKVRL